MDRELRIEHRELRTGNRNRELRTGNREPGPLGANQKSLRTNKGLPRVRPSPTFVMLRSLMIERQGAPATPAGTAARLTHIEQCGI